MEELPLTAVQYRRGWEVTEVNEDYTCVELNGHEWLVSSDKGGWLQVQYVDWDQPPECIQVHQTKYKTLAEAVEEIERVYVYVPNED